MSTTIICAVFLGVLCAYLVLNLSSLKVPKELALQRRLENIRLGEIKKIANSHDAEFSFLYSNFRYKFFAKRFNNFKFFDSLSGQIVYNSSIGFSFSCGACCSFDNFKNKSQKTLK